MFPLKDNIPAQRFPFVNFLLIGLNVAFFLLEGRMGPHLEAFLYDYGFVPARFSAALAEGFSAPALVPVFSSMFLHGSLLHLVGNMWMLWIFGDNVEDSMGHFRYSVFFLLCGTASVLAQYFSAPASSLPLVGASGAISGVMGAYFLTYPRARIVTLFPIFIFFYLFEVPAYFFLGLWAALQLLQGSAMTFLASAGDQEMGGVAWWAHFGGFVAGAGLVPLFRERQAKQKTRRWQRRGWWA